MATASGYQRIVGGDPDGLARRAAERLLHQAEQTTVTGVEKLARDGAASVEKFVNLLAELRFGLLFASLGARSQLLPDDAFAPAEYTPDLLVEFPSGLRMLVDAIRGSSGAPRLAEAIRERLRQKCLGFAVEHFLGYRLSVAASDHREHAASRELCQRVADQVTDEISRARTNGRTSGVFRVFEAKSSLRIDPAAELYDDVPSPPQEIWLGSFRFEPSFTGEGTAGSGATVACFVDDEKHGAKLLEKLRSKADRRVSLPHEHASTPYVIALQNDESELHPITVLSALTGRRQHLGRGIAAETEILAAPSRRGSPERMDYTAEGVGLHRFPVDAPC